ncbi:MAG: hypothetical protein WKG07_30740 [Hymenobacter sp.]
MLAAGLLAYAPAPARAQTARDLYDISVQLVPAGAGLARSPGPHEPRLW